MKFIDEAVIELHAGNGGNGVVAFRREKFLPKGGPSGGDGGNGGNIFGVANRNLNTLLEYRYSRIHKAKNGCQGGGSDQHGANAEDKILFFPVGTIIRDLENKKIVADLSEHGEKILLAKGGNGGLGNIRFKSSTNRTPRQCTSGKEGQIRRLGLEIKILADVGVFGSPNSGKSFFVNTVTNSKGKVADYPFTTLSPNLGVVFGNNMKNFVIADIPGLIAGASDGAGLGHHFLKHIQRTKLLLHFVDFSGLTLSSSSTQASESEIIDFIKKNISEIVFELKKFNDDLLKKPRWLIFTKVDLVPLKKRKMRWEKIKKTMDFPPVFFVSSFSYEGVDALLSNISKWLSRQDETVYFSKDDTRFRN